MNYIVLDLEWNQSPTGKEDEIKTIPFEIIEIGAVKLNEQQEILDQFSEMIKPQVYKKLDENVQEIVHVSMEDLQDGTPFPEVWKKFEDWCGEDYIFCTWGPMDLIELQRNITHYGFPALHSRPFFFYDVQKLFATFFDTEKMPRTLAFAADYFHLQEEGDFHSAICDAKYTARIFQKFDLKKTKKYMEIDYCNPPKCQADEFYVSFGSYAKHISMLYKSKDALLHSKEVKSTSCCICQAKASKKIDWFPNSSKTNYYGVFHCKEHGYLKGKLRVKKHNDNHYFAVKTIKIISKEEAIHLKKKSTSVKNKE